VFFSERKAFLLRDVNKENKNRCQGQGRDLGREKGRGNQPGREGAKWERDRRKEDINTKRTGN